MFHSESENFQFLTISKDKMDHILPKHKKCCNNFHPSWLIYGSHKPFALQSFLQIAKAILCLSLSLS